MTKVIIKVVHDSLTSGNVAITYSQCTSLSFVIRVAHPINPNRKL